jgi:CheY-like chemotaxis protein
MRNAGGGLEDEFRALMSRLVSLMPVGVYTCDSQGQLTFYNRQAAEMWGREPRLGDDQDRYCGSFRMWKPNGEPLNHDGSPMADAVRDARSARNVEVVIEQPSGKRLFANVNVDPLYDENHQVVGAINVFIEMTAPKGTVVSERGGAHCHPLFPFEGSTTMPAQPNLGGHRVLVVEDEYYIASDTARALQGAGAEVVGPVPSEDAARTELETKLPDAAIVDINLGRGPSFTLAETLKSRGIPFVFVTGYDQEVIPDQFVGIERLQKPVQRRQMIEAIARLVN